MGENLIINHPRRIAQSHDSIVYIAEIPEIFPSSPFTQDGKIVFQALGPLQARTGENFTQIIKRYEQWTNQLASLGEQQTQVPGLGKVNYHVVPNNLSIVDKHGTCIISPFAPGPRLSQILEFGEIQYTTFAELPIWETTILKALNTNFPSICKLHNALFIVEDALKSIVGETVLDSDNIKVRIDSEKRINLVITDIQQRIGQIVNY